MSIVAKWENAEYCDITVEKLGELPEAFDDLWLTKKNRLKVTFTNHSALTPTCSVTVRYRHSYTTVFLNGDTAYIDIKRGGEVLITCKASYHLSATLEENVTVQTRDYSDPQLLPTVKNATDIICGRCSDDGTMSAQGEQLRICATRAYAPVCSEGGTDQRNFCQIRYRWKRASTAEYGEWVTLLAGEELDTDTVDEVTGLTLERKYAYDIQVGVADTTQSAHTVTKRIPATMDTPLHLGRGGKNIGLGGFCDYSHEEAIDAFWDMWLHRGLEVLGDASFAGAVNVDGQLTLGGIGIKTVFRGETTEACWNGGQLLSEAFPNANPALLEQGRVFLAVVRSNGKQPVLCARVTDNISGAAVDCIAGSVVTLINTSGNYNPRRQDSLQFRMKPEGGDYRLSSFLLQIYDGSAYATVGEAVTPSRGIQEIAEDSVVIDALYVLL